MDEYISELDTLRFGFKVAKINRFDDQPAAIVRAFRQMGVKLVISRVATADVKLINAMEDAGFRFKDVQVTYNFDLADGVAPPPDEDGCLYRGFMQGDTEAITAMAAESFRDYGHYSVNEKTSLVNTSVIYEDWARRSCLDRDLADHIVVAEFQGSVAGFLSLKIRADEKARYAAGVMGAVRKEFRKHGLFRGINVASLHWAVREGLKRVENNVLVTNLPVNGTYIALGFKTIRSETTFHCWLG